MREWLVDARKKLGMTQKETAEACGIKQPTFFEYEQGISTPRPKIAKRVANVLGIPWTKFYERDD